MKLTNRLNLPAPIVDAVKADDYSRGAADISVTQLIDPPQKVWLEEQHADEIVEDVSDRIWALMGKSIHKILEQAESLMPVEKRLFGKCGGWVISGGMDRNALLKKDFGIEVQDYKMTSAWSIALEKGVKQDWVNQLNCYAWLLRENGYDPQKLTVVAFLRDWSKLEAKRKPDYPQQQVMVIDVPMWPVVEAASYVRGRVGLHQIYRAKTQAGGPADPMPGQCTPEERWERPTKWAVMKEGRKSALRVLDGEREAMQWCLDNGHATNEGNISTMKQHDEAWAIHSLAPRRGRAL
jgi:hypothetical protein